MIMAAKITKTKNFNQTEYTSWENTNNKVVLPLSHQQK